MRVSGDAVGESVTEGVPCIQVVQGVVLETRSVVVGSGGWSPGGCGVAGFVPVLLETPGGFLAIVVERMCPNVRECEASFERVGGLEPFEPEIGIATAKGLVEPLGCGSGQVKFFCVGDD